MARQTDAGGNGRVTLAVLSTKLDMVIERLDELGTMVAQNHDRTIQLEGRVHRLEDRVTAWQGIQTAIAAVLAAVAAWLGVRN